MIRAGALLALCLAGGRAWAAPTGLAIIPTTDLVPYRQVSVGVQNANTTLQGDGSVFHSPQPVPQLEIGLPREIEAGLDVVPADPPGDYQPQLNFKWRFLAEDDRRPAVAAGVSGIGPGFTPSYYLVASRTVDYAKIAYQRFRAHHRNIKLRGIRGHCGVVHAPDGWHALLGADLEVADRYAIYADWTSGTANAFSYGGAIIVDQQNSIVFALLHHNDEAHVVSGLLLTLTHTFSW